MALSTYAELSASIAGWLNRSDLTSVIPDFIQLAEAEMNTDLRVRSMRTAATITPSQSLDYVDLPDGYVETLSFADDLGTRIQEISLPKLYEYRFAAGNSRPTFYAITNRIEFNSKADASYSFDMVYYKGLDLATDLTNDVLTRYPNLYLYGALVMAEPYLKNDKRVTLWASLYQKTLTNANHRENKTRATLRTGMGSGRTYNINNGY